MSPRARNSQQRILQGVHEMNLAPVVMRWKKFDLGLVNSSAI